MPLGTVVQQKLSSSTQKHHWQWIAADDRAFVKGCHVCQLAKKATTKSGGELQPLHAPQGRFNSISSDQVLGMLLSDGVNGFITCTDYLTRYVCSCDTVPWHG
jgi:hypothetical protein